ncbi:MAG: hypothetical protein B6I28_01300 [Fusobacteriia bacterium 4572_132]|nr:MAG: hypothetical protein B6I28_01300 [Fusobacteriia bacterium 4572_132]
MAYDRNKDKVIHKALVKTEKRYLNVEVYSYDGGSIKVRIKPVSKNTNPNADSNKKWINGKAISGLTQEEVLGLIKSLNEVVGYF